MEHGAQSRIREAGQRELLFQDADPKMRFSRADLADQEKAGAVARLVLLSEF